MKLLTCHYFYYCYILLYLDYIACNLVSESQGYVHNCSTVPSKLELVGHFVSNYFIYLYPEFIPYQNQKKKETHKQTNKQKNKEKGPTHHRGQKGVDTWFNLIPWVSNNLWLMKSLEVLEEVLFLIKWIDFVLERQKIFRFTPILNSLQGGNTNLSRTKLLRTLIR